MGSYAPLSARRVLLDDGTADDVSERFFKRLELPNGTSKNTVAERFADLDAVLVSALGAPRRIRVLDMAVSSATATRALVQSLESGGFSVHATAADLQIAGSIKSFGAIDLLVHGETDVLQIAAGGLTLFRPSPSVRSLKASLGRVLFAGASALARRSPSAATPVSFIAPTVRTRHNIALAEHDVFLPRADWDGVYDVVRVCNLLSPRYFEETALRRALGNCAAWCRPGGILVVCRTQLPSETNHASLFLRTGHGPEPYFQTVGTVGGGSEVAGMVLRHPPAGAA